MGTKKATDKTQKALTEQQEKFCKCYVKTQNATAAFREVYDCSKIKPSTLNKRASDMLNAPHIKHRIETLYKLTENVANLKFQVTQESILKQLHTFATARIDDFIEIVEVTVKTKHGDGRTVTRKAQEIRLKDFKTLSPEQLQCIEAVTTTAKGINIKLQGKQWSYDMINRHIGFFEKDNDQRNKIFDSPEAREERINQLLNKAKAAKTAAAAGQQANPAPVIGKA